MKLYRVQSVIAMPDKAHDVDVQEAIKETVNAQFCEICDLWGIPLGIAKCKKIEGPIQHIKIVDWEIDDDGEDDWERWSNEVKSIFEKEING